MIQLAKKKEKAVEGKLTSGDLLAFYHDRLGVLSLGEGLTTVEVTKTEQEIVANLAEPSENGELKGSPGKVVVKHTIGEKDLTVALGMWHNVYEGNASEVLTTLSEDPDESVIHALDYLADKIYDFNKLYNASRPILLSDEELSKVEKISSMLVRTKKGESPSTPEEPPVEVPDPPTETEPGEKPPVTEPEEDPGPTDPEPPKEPEVDPGPTDPEVETPPKEPGEDTEHTDPKPPSSEPGEDTGHTDPKPPEESEGDTGHTDPEEVTPPKEPEEDPEHKVPEDGEHPTETEPVVKPPVSEPEGDPEHTVPEEEAPSGESDGDHSTGELPPKEPEQKGDSEQTATEDGGHSEEEHPVAEENHVESGEEV